MIASLQFSDTQLRKGSLERLVALAVHVSQYMIFKTGFASLKSSMNLQKPFCDFFGFFNEIATDTLPVF